MISVCTVIMDSIEGYMDVLIKSIVEQTRNITELIIVKVNSKNSTIEERVIGSLRVKTYDIMVGDSRLGHPLGLHEAIAKSNENYILFTDPDVFFYKDADKLYLDLYHKHNLSIIGISHHSALGLSIVFFPVVQNCLVKKDWLPGSEWLKGKIGVYNSLSIDGLPKEPSNQSMDGKYLMYGPIPGLYENFPNTTPNCSFDCGCNLWLWNEEQKGRWVSFQSLDCKLYKTMPYRSNFKLKDRLKNQKIVYHMTCGSMNPEEKVKFISEKYEEEKDG